MEEYKTILDYPDYEISNLGNVRRNGKILKSRQNKNTGYSYIDLRKEGKRTTCYIHRLVALTFLPKIEDKEYIDHIDRNKNNNNLNNLRWVSRSENNRNTKKRDNDLFGLCYTRNKWRLTINEVYVGEYKTPEEAKVIRDLTLSYL